MKGRDQQKVFIDIFTEYGDAIFRFCLLKVSNVELAEDLTQETFTRYWQYVRADKEMTNTRSLLYTIAHNLAKDWYRRKKEDSLDARMDAGYDPADDALGTERYAQYMELVDTISDLEEGDREVLLLRYVEGLEPRDIAEILDETANAISVRINRATKRLRKKLHLA